MFQFTTHHIRTLIVTSLMVAGLVALGYRIYDLQVVRHEELSRSVAKIHERRIRLSARRGNILDCHQNLLAHSVVVNTVSIDPEFLREEDQRRQKSGEPSALGKVASLLAKELDIPLKDVQEQIQEDRRYAILKKKVPEQTAEVIRTELASLGIRGVIFEDDQHRFYPNGQLMSHVLGYVNADEKGVDGVEYLMQRDLMGQDGWRQISRDSRGREMVVFRSEDFPERNGYNVVLTLDQAIQSIVEQELDVAVQKYRPDSAVAILMRPSTGEILALANRPTFNPNSSRKEIETLKNRAFSDMIEPGSTFKIVTVATALDRRVISLNDVIWCENGRFLHEGRYITDTSPHGNLNIVQILARSSNIGAAKVALLLKEQRFYEGIVKFGFGQRALGDLPDTGWLGEIRGLVRPLKNWSKLSISHIAMGYEVGVTPIQMVTAMCAIANGGNLMRPMVVKRVMNSEGHVVREFSPLVRRRVVDKRAASELTQALCQVVTEEGTAVKAKIPGFQVAGKTGTSHKLVDGKYVDQYISSFCGYFPAGNPQVCLYLMFNNPKGKEYYGGQVTAPLFHDIGVRLVSYLDLKPDPTLEAGYEDKVASLVTGRGVP